MTLSYSVTSEDIWLPIAIKKVQLRSPKATLSHLAMYYSEAKGALVLEAIVANNTTSAITIQPSFMVACVRNDKSLYTLQSISTSSY